MPFHIRLFRIRLFHIKLFPIRPFRIRLFQLGHSKLGYFEACALSSTVMMYADDACLTACNHDLNALELQLNDDLTKAQLWLQTNKLTVNVKKTKYVVIASKNKLKGLNHDPEIKINNQTVERMHSYKYLGIEIDESLNWQAQIEIICKKVSAGLGALKRIRDFVPHRILLKMCDALVLSYFQYCSEVWGCVGKCLSDKLQKLQNRAGRIITYSDYSVRSADILDILGWEILNINAPDNWELVYLKLEIISILPSLNLCLNQHPMFIHTT